MYYKMRILPVIFLFSMMTKAQDKVVLGFLIHGVNLILNKGMTGIWTARRYWLFFLPNNFIKITLVRVTLSFLFFTKVT